MKKRIIIYSLIFVFSIICLSLNSHFKEEARFYSWFDGCGVKGCEKDLWDKTYQLFLQKELLKKGIASYFDEDGNYPAMNLQRKVISFEENGVRKKKIIWLEPGENYKWHTVFFGDDDTDFFKSINENF
jgi:hypothetical protein